MHPDDDTQDVRRAIHARDAARARLRRVTGAAVAATFALSGIFAALAAGSTHPRKTVVPGTTAVTGARLPALAAAPQAPLVSADAGASAQAASAGAAPAATAQAPVVSSGGS